MAFGIQHVHIKSHDPKKAAQFYIDNLGATMVGEISGRGWRVNLHGLTLNITSIIASQKREQKLGIEHIAVETDDYAGTLSKMRDNGARILEEMPPGPNGRRVAFVEAPGGEQVEILEKV